MTECAGCGRIIGGHPRWCCHCVERGESDGRQGVPYSPCGVRYNTSYHEGKAWARKLEAKMTKRRERRAEVEARVAAEASA